MTLSYVPPPYDFEAQHNGTEQLAINNTFVQRMLTRLALYTTAKFYSENGLCVPISKHKIVKTIHVRHLQFASPCTTGKASEKGDETLFGLRSWR